MPINLETDWVRIAVSGATIDGRTIEPQWLRDASETYNPAIYTAVINVDHMDGNLGSVRQLRTVTVGKEIALEAKIRPNMQYFIRNQGWQEKLFFSMELVLKFRGTDKAYLTGLAATDDPASVGTTEMHFAKGKNVPGSVHFAFTDVEKFTSEPEKKTFTDQLRNAFLTFFKTQPQPQEDEQMNPEIKALFEAQHAQITALAATVTTLVEKLTVKPAEPPQDAEKSAPAPEIMALTASVNKLGEDFNAFSVKFESALQKSLPGTKTEPQTGAAGTDDDDLC